jgi:hypothetical protein
MKMISIDGRTRSIMEVRLKNSRSGWVGEMERLPDRKMKVRLQPMEGESSLPVWIPGTILECIIHNPIGLMITEAKLQCQKQNLIWLEMSSEWRSMERRSRERIQGGFAVGYTFGDECGIGTCVDISTSGLRLQVSHPIPDKTVLKLIFMLPGEYVTRFYSGMTLYCRETEHDNKTVLVGVKFLNVTPEQGMHLSKFCGLHRGSYSQNR